MTAKEAIESLSKLADKELVVLIDCPYCGRGNQLQSIDQCVVLQSERAAPKPEGPNNSEVKRS